MHHDASSCSADAKSALESVPIPPWVVAVSAGAVVEGIVVDVSAPSIEAVVARPCAPVEPVIVMHRDLDVSDVPGARLKVRSV